MSPWWRFWHIYRWRALATVAGAFCRFLERVHDRWHVSTRPECDMCIFPFEFIQADELKRLTEVVEECEWCRGWDEVYACAHCGRSDGIAPEADHAE